MTNNAIIIEKLPDEGGGGANILNGTTDPTADLGIDGQLYLKYDPDSGSIPPEVDSHVLFAPQMDSPTIAEISEFGALVCYTPNSFYFYIAGTVKPVYIFYYNNYSYYASEVNPGPYAYYNSVFPDVSYSEGSSLTYNSDYNLYYNSLVSISGRTIDKTKCGSITDGLAYVRAYIDSAAEAKNAITSLYVKVNGVWQKIIGSSLDDVNTKG